VVVLCITLAQIFYAQHKGEVIIDIILFQLFFNFFFNRDEFSEMSSLRNTMVTQSLFLTDKVTSSLEVTLALVYPTTTIPTVVEVILPQNSRNALSGTTKPD
jgi:hypothetical protein